MPAGAVTATSSDLASGAGETHLSIDDPKFHGIEPDLTLRYNSTRSNGPLGVGWTVDSLKYIERVSSTRGVPAYNASDIFLLAGEQLINCWTGGRTEPNPLPASCQRARHTGIAASDAFTTRAESGVSASRRIDSTSGLSTWTVIVADGITSTYTPDVVVTTDSGRAEWRWHLSEVHDLSGNVVRYGYDVPAVGQEPNLTTIDYNGTHISLFYEARPDTISTAIGQGVLHRTTRLRTLEIATDPPHTHMLVNAAYGLNYTQSPSTSRSILNAVRKYGADAVVDPRSGTISGPSPPVQTQTFAVASARTPESATDWAPVTAPAQVPPDGGPRYELPVTVAQPTPEYWQATDPGLLARLTGDLDGDNRSDSVFLTQTTTDCSVSASVLLASSDPMIAVVSSMAIPQPCHSPYLNVTYPDARWIVGDVDGDGRSDLVAVLPKIYGSSTDKSANSRLVTFLSRGNGTLSPPIVSQFPTAFPGDTTWEAPDCAAGDTTGMRRSDLVCLSRAGAPTSSSVIDLHFDPARSDYATTTSTALPINLSVGTRPYDQTPLSFLLVDVNGDRRADLVHLDCADRECSKVTGITTVFATGDGNFRDPTDDSVPSDTPAGSGWGFAIGNLGLADLDHDGLPDLVAVARRFHPHDPHNAADSFVVSARSTGDGHWSYATQAVPDYLGQAYPSGLPPVVFGNVAGPGESGFLLPVRQQPDTVTCGGQSLRIPVTHPEILRIRSAGDGTFAWPDAATLGGSSADNCRDTWETTIDISRTDPTDAGGYYIPDLSAIGEPDDLNGDGTVDLEFWHPREYQPAGNCTNDPTLCAAVQVQTPVPPHDQHVWQPAQSSSGDTDLVNLTATPSGVTLQELAPATSCKHLIDCGRNLYRSHELTPPRETSSNWRVMDIQGRGQSTIVSIGSIASRIIPFPTIPPFYTTELTTYLPDPKGGWQSTPVVTTLRYTGIADAQNWVPADVDGNGRQDLLHVVIDPANGCTRVALLTADDGGHWSLAYGNTICGPPAYTRWTVGDVNRDGLADLVHVDSPGDHVTIETLLNQGQGHWTFVSQDEAVVGDRLAAGWTVGDLDGDGVADVVHSSSVRSSPSQVITEYLGDGSGHFEAESPITITTGGRVAYEDPTWHIADVRGSGSPRLVHIGRETPGVSGSPLQLGEIVPSGSGGQTLVDNPISNVGAPLWELDGLTDSGYEYLFGTTTKASVGGRSEIDVAELSDNHAADVVTNVANGLGGTAQLRYSGTAELASGAPACGIPVGTITFHVTGVTLSASRGAAVIGTELAFGCPVWSPQSHAMLGWETVDVTRAAGRVHPAIATHYGSLLTEDCGAQPTQIEVRSGSTALVHKVVSYVPPRAGPQQVSADCGVATDDTAQCDAQTGACLHAMGTYGYDDDGNLKDALLTESGGAPARRYTFDYRHSLVPYVRNRLATESVYEGGSAGPLRHTEYCYDERCGTGSADLTRGLLTSVTSGTDPDHLRILRTSYDRYGNPVTSVDGDGQVTRTTYDGYFHMFPVRVTNPLGQEQVMRWDGPHGLLMSLRDIDGSTTHYAYDSSGRPIRVQRAGYPTISTFYGSTGLLAGTGGTRVTTSIADGSANGIWQSDFYDGLGRPSAVARKSAEAGQIDLTTSSYADETGSPSLRTPWVRVPGGPGGASTALPALSGEQMSYDALGRTSSVTHPDGSRVTYSYTVTADGQAHTTRRDEIGDSSAVDTDAWGQVVSQEDGTGSAPSSYTYDGVGDLVRSARGPLVTNQTWDALGELTVRDDPDSGRDQFIYDAAGDLVRADGPAGTAVTLTYDQIHRITSETVPGSIPRTWTWGSGPGPSAGQLVRVTGPDTAGCGRQSAKTLAYDSAGRLASVTACNAGVLERFGYGYDRVGRVAQETYPDHESVTSTYDGAGRPRSLGSYVQNAEYDPAGQLVRMAIGDGTTVRHDYVPSTARLHDTVVETVGRTLSSTTYSYAASGAITAELTTTPSGSITTNYRYDNAGHLSASTGGTIGSWTFDITGRLAASSTLGGYTYPQPNCTSATCGPPSGPVTAGGYTYAYNTGGEVVDRKTPTADERFTWSATGAPTQIATSRSRSQLSYSASGRLVRQSGSVTDAVGRTHPFDERYFGAQAEVRDGALLKNYVFNGAVVARASTGQHGAVSYEVADDRGSATFVERNGSVTGVDHYGPYGTDTSSKTAAVRGFDGATRLQGTDVLQMGARLYDPATGQFLSPDPARQANPLARNNQSYLFAAGNPIGRGDPTGLGPCEYQAAEAGGDSGCSVDGWTFKEGPTTTSSPNGPNNPPELSVIVDVTVPGGNETVDGSELGFGAEDIEGPPGVAPTVGEVFSGSESAGGEQTAPESGTAGSGSNGAGTPMTLQEAIFRGLGGTGQFTPGPRPTTSIDKAATALLLLPVAVVGGAVALGSLTAGEAEVALVETAEDPMALGKLRELETLDGLPGQQTRFPSVTQTAPYRVADLLNQGVGLVEIKNGLSTLYMTQQIVDGVLWAQALSIPYLLVTQSHELVELSGPLQEAINEGWILWVPGL